LIASKPTQPAQGGDDAQRPRPFHHPAQAVAGQPAFREVAGLGNVVNAGGCVLQQLRIEIAGQHLPARVAGVFGGDHGQAPGFFTGGAGGAPQAQGVLVFSQPGRPAEMAVSRKK
jgi:hypothetical protein